MLPEAGTTYLSKHCQESYGGQRTTPSVDSPQASYERVVSPRKGHRG